LRPKARCGVSGGPSMRPCDARSFPTTWNRSSGAFRHPSTSTEVDRAHRVLLSFSATPDRWRKARVSTHPGRSPPGPAGSVLTRMLLDSGADCAVVSAALAHRLGLSSEAKARGRGIAGRPRLGGLGSSSRSITPRVGCRPRRYPWRCPSMARRRWPSSVERVSSRPMTSSFGSGRLRNGACSV